MNDNISTVNSVEAHEDERGASLVEYALLVALIAIVAIVAVRTLGTSVSTKFSSLSVTVGSD